MKTEAKATVEQLPPQQIYGSEKDLFRLTGIPPKGWQKLRWKKSGPPVYRRPGSNRVVYKFSEVFSWLESQRVEPARGE